MSDEHRKLVSEFLEAHNKESWLAELLRTVRLEEAKWWMYTMKTQDMAIQHIAALEKP